DPLMHLLRNSVDHGIEADPEVRVAAGKSAQGEVRLSAFTEGNQVVIEVTDDGGGISVDQVVAKAIRNGLVTEEQAQNMPHQEQLDLVFAAGLSTRESASTISGRGVGMDVVRSAAVKLGGNVTIESTPGKGSVFTIRLPLSLAVTEALLVRVADETWAIPIDQIEETLAVQPADVRTVRGNPMIDIRGEVIPLVHGPEILYGVTPHDKVKEAVVYVYKGRRTALTVDHLIGRFEVVVKPLPEDIQTSGAASAVTILGDGTVGLIMNVSALAEQHRLGVSRVTV
ncbi:MAG: chemotaxis protein CheA, partial [Acidimicrobiales bacterium]